MRDDSNRRRQVSRRDDCPNQFECSKIILLPIIACNGIPRINQDNSGIKYFDRFAELLPEFPTLKAEPARWRWRYANIFIKQFGIQFGKFLLKSKTAILILDYQGLEFRMNLESEPIMAGSAGLR